MSGTRCSICKHAQRQAMDRLLVRGQSARSVASQFGVDRTSVWRHQKSHLSPGMVAVTKRKSQTLLDRAEALVTVAESIMDQAQANGQPTLALDAIREVRESMRLLGKLNGELDERSVSNTLVLNVTDSKEWLDLKSKLLEALRPYPQAGAAVAAALLASEPTAVDVASIRKVGPGAQA